MLKGSIWLERKQISEHSDKHLPFLPMPMKIPLLHRSLTCLICATCVAASSSAVEPAPASALPTGVRLFEAEAFAGAGDGVRSDPTAGGSFYVTNPRAWNPVIRFTLPPEISDTLITVWARVRGGPFQLKGTPDGKQIDLNWNYTKPAAWEWLNYGTYPRANLGDTFLLIRSASLADDGGIDQFVISSASTFDPLTLASPAASSSVSSPLPTASRLPPISIPSGGWFPPGWVPRRTLFRDSLAADQGAVVFVGDSITQGFNAAAIFPGLKSANRGISGDIAGNLKHRLQGDVLDVNPKAVVLLMGTNDAKDGKPAAAIVADIRAAAEKIHAALPAIPVIVSRLLPRAPRAGQAKEAALLPAAILEVNALIDQLPAQLPWLTVADPFTSMAQPDGSPRPGLFGDGVHPNSAGNAALAAALAPVLRSASLLP